MRQVVPQTKARVFRRVTQYAHKIVSLFEPHTEIIRKGKASKPNEFACWESTCCGMCIADRHAKAAGSDFALEQLIEELKQIQLIQQFVADSSSPCGW